MSRFPNLQPLGIITVSAPGTTTLLSVNCGPLGGGTVGTTANPPLAGTPFRSIVLQAPLTLGGGLQTNVGNAYLMPRGSTFTANPGNVLAVIPPGATISFPYAGLPENGILPENFCIDADTAGNTIVGYGIY
jgi:hypothetical protein